MEKEIRIRIRRGGAAGAADGPAERYQRYTLRARERMTLLDALVAIQTGPDPSLSFRYSCRVGMCGTCALQANGRARWACRTLLSELGDEITLAPLPHFPVVRDLAVEMTPFFEKMQKARGWLEPTAAAAAAPAETPPEGAERGKIEPHIECITCGICYASCTMVGHEPDFLGPAALNRAYTLVCDSRDAVGAGRLEELADEHGIWRCHGQFNCTEACPKGISPTEAIQGLRRQALAHAGKTHLPLLFGGGSSNAR